MILKEIKKGFTLIELLVVISIIGILAALMFPNFMTAQRQAQDARRKSDIDQVRKALELYKNSQTVPIYPTTATFKASLANYMNPVVTDPKYQATCNSASEICWPDYIYTFNPSGTDTLSYSITACLENINDQHKDASTVGTCTTAGAPASFTRYNP